MQWMYLSPWVMGFVDSMHKEAGNSLKLMTRFGQYMNLTASQGLKIMELSAS